MKGIIVVALVLSTYIVAAPSALAQNVVPPSNSGIDAYVPSTPGAAGDRAVGRKGAGNRRAPLSRETRARLRSAPEGSLLGSIATSSTLGAPTAEELAPRGAMAKAARSEGRESFNRDERSSRGRDPSPARDRSRDGASGFPTGRVPPSGPVAVADALGSSTRLVWLISGLAAVLAVGVAALILRRRASRDESAPWRSS